MANSRDLRKTDVSYSAEEKRSVRIDELVSGSYSVTYLGYAHLGAQDSDSVWSILKIAESGSLTQVYYANGSKHYENIWNNRLSLEYR